MDDTGGSTGFVVAVAPEKLCSKGLGSWSSFELEFKGSTAIGGSLSTTYQYDMSISHSHPLLLSPLRLLWRVKRGEEEEALY